MQDANNRGKRGTGKEVYRNSVFSAQIFNKSETSKITKV